MEKGCWNIHTDPVVIYINNYYIMSFERLHARKVGRGNAHTTELKYDVEGAFEEKDSAGNETECTLLRDILQANMTMEDISTSSPVTLFQKPT